MTLSEALSDLADNCDHLVESDCWYCELSQLLQEQASKLDTRNREYESLERNREYWKVEAELLQSRLDQQVLAGVEAINQRDKYRAALTQCEVLRHDPGAVRVVVRDALGWEPKS